MFFYFYFVFVLLLLLFVFQRALSHFLNGLIQNAHHCFEKNEYNRALVKCIWFVKGLNPGVIS